jgi:hypothetical protein
MKKWIIDLVGDSEVELGPYTYAILADRVEFSNESGVVVAVYRLEQVQGWRIKC